MSIGEDKLFDAPEGYVGWAGKIEQPTFKMYVSRISDDFVMKQYGKYARSVELETLQLHPKREGKTIQDVFSKNSGSFSYHFGHEVHI